jgi:hypothetical protein
MVEHLRDQFRRVLQVAVDHHHGVAGGMFQPRGERCLVTEVSRQVHDLHARVAVREPIQQLARPVVARVVRDHDLEREPVEYGCHATIELLDEARLVVHRSHDAE